MKCLSDYVPEASIARVLEEAAYQHRLPGRVFRDTDYLQFEFEQWLNRTWLFVGRLADLPTVGDVRTTPGLASSENLLWIQRASDNPTTS